MSRDTIRRIQQSKTASYPGAEVAALMNEWIEKQLIRAVEASSLINLTYAPLQKVPNERVYIYDGGTKRTPLTIHGGSDMLQSMTLIVKNADLIIM